jgi:spermidine/putrescine transport system ATP-binding protein
MPVIAVEHVSKRFGDYTAVADASFDVKRGEFFSLLGPSGCGKTTLLRMIAGFESVSSGVLRLDGADVSAVPPNRRNVNTVFQNYALFPHLTVFENVAFGPRIAGQHGRALEQKVRAMLDTVRLGEFAHRHPHQLSGGERQRVALARALVNGPSALLLDEPLSALDVELRRHMQLELKRIQRESGIAFVFVTHDQEEALTMSDRIAVMRAGRLEQIGAPEDIYRRPVSVFIARFVGIANLLPVTIERAGGAHAQVRLAGDRRAEAPTGGRGFVPNASAILMIRPEWMRFSTAEPAADTPSLPVTIVDVVFQGERLRVAMRDGDDNELVAHIATAQRQGGQQTRAGARAWVCWDAANALLLPVDQAPTSS